MLRVDTVAIMINYFRNIPRYQCANHSTIAFDRPTNNHLGRGDSDNSEMEMLCMNDGFAAE